MRTRIYLVLFVCFSLLKTFAQSYEEQYLSEEKARLDKVKVIENEIQTFTNQNINTYDFTEVTNNVNSLKDEEGNSLSGNSYEETLLQAKKQKLRDVFFQQNPEKLKYFYATTLKQQCVNGGFENGTTAGFSMGTRTYNPPNWNAYNMFPPSSNSSFVSLVDNSIPDPLINNLSRVNTGRFAIRVNNSVNGQYDVSMLTRQFVVNENFISFAYALVFGNSPSHFNTGDNPYYQVRLLNSNNVPVYTRNVMLNPNNTGFLNLPNSHIFYTNWSCERIDTSQFIGQTVTLQIIMADCGGSAHWGYGYFDDFCGFTCNQPAFNPNISLHPIKQQDCPNFPLQITGNISLPPNASFTNVTLQVVDNSNNIINSKILTSAPGGFFSTDLYYNDFYPNGYSSNTDFNIWAFLNYSINGTPQQSVFTSNTNPPGPDISFKNCPIPCQEEWQFMANQPIQASANFQASCCITSESAIYPNINVEFRAGYEIILKPASNGTAGFYATSHQSGNFHAYIARCDESTNFSKIQTAQSKIITKNISDDSNIKISPNPTSTFINIDSGDEKINSWELLDISGRIILKGSSTQIDVQSLPKAIYLINININNKTVTKKVIVK